MPFHGQQYINAKDVQLIFSCANTIELLKSLVRFTLRLAIRKTIFMTPDYH